MLRGPTINLISFSGIAYCRMPLFQPTVAEPRPMGLRAMRVMKMPLREPNQDLASETVFVTAALNGCVFSAEMEAALPLVVALALEPG